MQGLTVSSEWYVLFGAALCGIGASLFWASEATIAVGYPSESQRGRMVAIWLGIRNLGPLISGIISVGLNAKGRGAGKVSYTTYLVLIAIQCLGFPISLLLSPPNKVVRPDGTKVPYLKGKNTTVMQELRSLWHVTKTPQFALLIPIFITGIWGSTYQSNYLTAYFSVRSRALAALLTAIANILADVLFGIFTDAKWLGNQARRARIIWAFMAICTTGLWVWQMVVEVNFNRNSTPVDWDGSTGRFNSAFAVLILWKHVQTNILTITRFFYEAQLAYLYWLVGTYKHVDGTLERTVGVLRTFESLGSCLSYVVGATHWPNLNQGILSFALWMACLIPTTLAVGRVPPHKVEVVLAENHEDIGNSETGSGLDHKVQVSLDDASSDELKNSTDLKRNSLPSAP